MPLDEDTLKESALAHVKEAISIAAVRVRKASEGLSSDTALYSELEEVARKSIDINMGFDIGELRGYLNSYPELMYKRAINGTIAESIKAALVDFILDDMKADIAELHFDQFEKFDDKVVKDWGTKGIKTVQQHGDPVSRNMRELLSVNASEASYPELGEIGELLEHLSDRVMAHAHYQRDQDKPEYETLARRLQEIREHVWITADKQIATLKKPTTAAPSI